VAVACEFGSSGRQTLAMLDTAAEWCVVEREAAEALGLVGGAGGESAVLQSRLGTFRGELVRVPVRFVAAEGDPVEIEATCFVSEEWPGPTVLGWKGALERAVTCLDPFEERFLFAVPE
jgi:hypothetical protein